MSRLQKFYYVFTITLVLTAFVFIAYIVMMYALDLNTAYCTDDKKQILVTITPKDGASVKEIENSLKEFELWLNKLYSTVMTFVILGVAANVAASVQEGIVAKVGTFVTVSAISYVLLYYM